MLQNAAPGTVIKWENFPYQEDKILKDRYFVCLGKTGYGVNPVLVYICTTTTQKKHYQSGGLREKNSHLYFKKGEAGFKRNCVIDVDLGMESVNAATLDNENIEKTGKLAEEVIKKIYSLILGSNSIPPKVKRDIYFSFQKHGIHGIRRP